MHEAGIRGRMWRVVKAIYANVTSRMRVNGELLDAFGVDVGVSHLRHVSEDISHTERMANE